MQDRSARARAFAALHIAGAPLELYNIWDAGSAAAAARAGAPAVATGSWSVAESHGFRDGEALPLATLTMTVAEIVAAVDLPVSLDLESGYARAPEAVGANVGRAIDAGAIGVNLEDQIIGGDGIYETPAQAARLAAARHAADARNIPAFINARTDTFLKAPAKDHDAAAVDRALERARAYANAGASGFFAPGLAAPSLIERLCAAAPLPVNILVRPDVPSSRRLAELGVARISHGPGPYRAALKALEAAAREIYRRDA